MMFIVQAKRKNLLYTLYMNIGERLKELRLEYGLSQAKLAKETGLTQSSIFYWEKGLKIPTAQAVVILAKYFGVTTDYLLGL